jgi:TolB protein
VGCSGQGSSVFSPDGKRIAFSWTKGAQLAAIFTVNVSGTGGLKQLTAWKSGLADKIDWSPDGSQIAYSSPEFGRTGKSSNVFTVRADGTGGIVQLTHDSGGKINDGLDTWSPDGKKIVFVSNRAGTSALYSMNADGTGVTKIPTGHDAHLAAWGTHP